MVCILYVGYILILVRSGFREWSTVYVPLSRPTSVIRLRLRVAVIQTVSWPIKFATDTTRTFILQTFIAQRSCADDMADGT